MNDASYPYGRYEMVYAESAVDVLGLTMDADAVNGGCDVLHSICWITGLHAWRHGLMPPMKNLFRMIHDALFKLSNLNMSFTILSNEGYRFFMRSIVEQHACEWYDMDIFHLRRTSSGRSTPYRP